MMSCDIIEVGGVINNNFTRNKYCLKSELDKYLLDKANECDKEIAYIGLDNLYRMRNLTIFKGDKKVKYSSLLNIEISAKVNFLL